jgi:type VI secretion system secreted protein Hcp
MSLTDLAGESTRAGFEGWIEIYSFSFGASNPTTVGSGAAGMAAGKVSVSSFNVMKKTEAGSPTLFSKCCMGDSFATASIVLNKASGDKKTPLSFLKFDFKEVYVDSIQWSGSTGGDDTPTESVSFAFANVVITYTPQTKTGVGGKAVIANWDLTTVSAS